MVKLIKTKCHLKKCMSYFRAHKYYDSIPWIAKQAEKTEISASRAEINSSKCPNKNRG